MDVLRGNVPQIDLVDPHAVVHVERHARGSDMIGDAKLRMRRELDGIRRLTYKRVLWGTILSPRIFLLHGTDDFEETRAAADAVGLEGGGDRETDRLARAALICDHEIRGQRIQSSLHTFDRGIECLEIDGDIHAFLRLHLHPSQEEYSTNVFCL